MSEQRIDYLKAELLLEQAGVEHTIVIFGGTRVPEPSVARHCVERLKAELAADPESHTAAKRLAIAERIAAKSVYYDIARELGRLVGGCSGSRDDCRIVLMTGGGPGLMEAANRGAYDVGAKSVGLNITLPLEQFPNPYVTPEFCLRFHYFAMRKLHFRHRARALVAFPGGFGTLGDLFETLTLVQTRTIDPVPIVLVGEQYWRRCLRHRLPRRRRRHRGGGSGPLLVFRDGRGRLAHDPRVARGERHAAVVKLGRFRNGTKLAGIPVFGKEGAPMRIVGLVGWFLVTFAAALIGSIASIRATEFYGALEVPSWAPPGSVFGPVWTVLYALMAVAAWLVWRAHGWQGARTALTLFLIQLAANALWSWLFFAWRLGLAAFIGPPVATERLSLTEGGLVRCALKTPYPVRSKRGH